MLVEQVVVFTTWAFLEKPLRKQRTHPKDASLIRVESPIGGEKARTRDECPQADCSGSAGLMMPAAISCCRYSAHNFCRGCAMRGAADSSAVARSRRCIATLARRFAFLTACLALSLLVLHLREAETRKTKDQGQPG